MRKSKSLNQANYSKIKARIEYMCEVNSLTIKGLANLIGMPERTLYERQSKPNTYRVDELFNIATVLRTTIQDLFI